MPSFWFDEVFLSGKKTEVGEFQSITKMAI
jgi:hypothetical protein